MNIDPNLPLDYKHHDTGIDDKIDEDTDDEPEVDEALIEE
jgi:hypothetical protein